MSYIQADDEKVQKIKEILGLPDEAYQSITIRIKMKDVTRIEAEFIAKGDVEDEGDSTPIKHE